MSVFQSRSQDEKIKISVGPGGGRVSTSRTNENEHTSTMEGSAFIFVRPRSDGLNLFTKISFLTACTNANNEST
jgi:hypothetical protein